LTATEVTRNVEVEKQLKSVLKKASESTSAISVKKEKVVHSPLSTLLLVVFTFTYLCNAMRAYII
jgi:hypothetical protein